MAAVKVMMERMTMERAVSRQQIVMVRDWDAYRASLLGQESRALTKPNMSGRIARKDGQRLKG